MSCRLDTSPWTCWLTLTIWIQARQPWSCRWVFGTDLAPLCLSLLLMVAPTGALPSAVNAAFHATPDTLNGAAVARVQKSESDRKLGVKVGTAPTTAVAGKLGVTLLSRPA